MSNSTRQSLSAEICEFGSLWKLISCGVDLHADERSGQFSCVEGEGPDSGPPRRYLNERIALRPRIDSCPPTGSRRLPRTALPFGGLVDQTSTRSSNPPQNMRLPSNGIDLGSIVLARRGSFMTFSLTRSRCARDSYTIHANTTVSFRLSLTLCGNDVTLPGFTSSAMHSTYSSAPCSRQILPACRAKRRYSSTLFF